jgi:hypothetical protein
MRTTRLFATLAAAVAALAVDAAPAWATTIADLSIEQVTDASTYIVQGTVTDVWTEMDDQGYVWTRARLDVSRVLKGPDSPDELVVDTLGGSFGLSTTWVHGAARFTETEEVLVFLDTIRDGSRYSPVAMNRGKYTIRRAPDDTKKHVMQWESDPRETFDARFLPHPALQDRVYLDEVVAQVQRRLDVGWDGRPIPGLSSEKLRAINTADRRKR